MLLSSYSILTIKLLFISVFTILNTKSLKKTYTGCMQGLFPKIMGGTDPQFQTFLHQIQMAKSLEQGVLLGVSGVSFD